MEIIKFSHTEEELSDIRRICRDFEFLDTYEIFFQDPYYQVYLASIDGKNFGLMVLSRHSYNLCGDFLWVDGDHRNGKIGTRLVEMALDLGRKEGYRSFIGDSLSTNIKAHHLYERLGATKYGEYINLYGEGKEIIFMFRIVFPENLNKILK